jgi:ketosteroid isomerase-like protein
MILSRAPKVSCAFALLALAGACGETVDLEKAVNSLVDVERNYNKLASEKGFRAASIDVFAAEGVAFAPKPVNGKKFWEKETEDPLLTWQPIFASISRDGELGYTTGPWELKKARDSEQAQGFGQYVTVWRKENDRSWKVVVDVGVEHSQPKEPPDDVETFLPDFPIARPESVREKLQEAEKALVDLLAKDAGAAVLAKASDNVRIFRRGEFPGIGKAAAQLMLGSDHGKEMRARAGGGMSRSNDLAYSYGEYSSERANVTEHGIYLSIWQLDLSSEWRLVLDLQKKAPEKK